MGTFGETDLSKLKAVTKFSFTKESLLIGLWGFDDADHINGIGVIKYDTSSLCYKNLKTQVDAFEEVDDSVKSKNDKIEEAEGVDILTIGVYTAGVFFAILLVFICVLTIERIRKNRKNITEVVEMKPVDLTAHFEGVAQRHGGTPKVIS